MRRAWLVWTLPVAACGAPQATAHLAAGCPAAAATPAPAPDCTTDIGWSEPSNGLRARIGSTRLVGYPMTFTICARNDGTAPARLHMSPTSMHRWRFALAQAKGEALVCEQPEPQRRNAAPVDIAAGATVALTFRCGSFRKSSWELGSVPAGQWTASFQYEHNGQESFLSAAEKSQPFWTGVLSANVDNVAVDAPIAPLRASRADVKLYDPYIRYWTVEQGIDRGDAPAPTAEILGFELEIEAHDEPIHFTRWSVRIAGAERNVSAKLAHAPKHISWYGDVPRGERRRIVMALDPFSIDPKQTYVFDIELEDACGRRVVLKSKPIRPTRRKRANGPPVA